MAQEWNIKSRSDSCSSCEAQFNDQDDCYSALMFTADDGYVRGDYCTDCWNKQASEGSAVSTWHGIFTVPPPEKEEPLKKETAESLLRKMLEDDEPNISVIYILAVMLERKRILVERDVQVTENSTIRIYEHKKTGETFLVTEPHLQLDKLEEVQQQVVDLLGGGKGNDEGGKGNDEAGTQSNEEKKKNEHPTMNAQNPMSKENLEESLDLSDKLDMSDAFDENSEEVLPES